MPGGGSRFITNGPEPAIAAPLFIEAIEIYDNLTQAAVERHVEARIERLGYPAAPDAPVAFIRRGRGGMSKPTTRRFRGSAALSR